MAYEEENDYDKETEKPENVQWDDSSWSGFKKPFSAFEHEDFAPALKETELMDQIGDDTLGKEIRASVDGNVGIRNEGERVELINEIKSAKDGMHHVQSGKEFS